MTDDEKNDWGFTRRLMGRIPDVMSRALVAGTGALFLTEEGIRNLVSELKLPGEMVRFLVQQADSTKRELFRFVGQEIRSFMEQSNLSQELLKALAGVTVEVHTTIRFVPDEAGGVSPRFRSEVQTAPTATEGKLVEGAATGQAASGTSEAGKAPAAPPPASRAPGTRTPPKAEAQGETAASPAVASPPPPRGEEREPVAEQGGATGGSKGAGPGGKKPDDAGSS